MSQEILMDDDQFWGLLDSSRKNVDNCDDQAEKLTALLEQLESADIVSFKQRFDSYMDQSYLWDLWAVAYIINGGCSDDGFDYFRSWLIGQGRDYFMTALNNPQRAADNAEVNGENECEALMYSAYDAYESKTGESDFPQVAATEAVNRGPAGEEWDEDDLPDLFPELCEKFGF